jgi:hypothetical protein
MIWNGPTWLCPLCEFVNAELRKRCRNCLAARPAPELPEPAGDIPLEKSFAGERSACEEGSP